MGGICRQTDACRGRRWSAAPDAGTPVPRAASGPGGRGPGPGRNRAGGHHRADDHGRERQPADRHRRPGDLRRQPHRHGGDLPGPADGAAGEPHPVRRAGLRARWPAALAPAARGLADQPAGRARGAAGRGLRSGRQGRPVARGEHAAVRLPRRPHRHRGSWPDVPGRRHVDPGHQAAGAAGGLVGRAPGHVPGPVPGVRARHRARPVVRRPSADPAGVVRGVGGHRRGGAGLPGRACPPSAASGTACGSPRCGRKDPGWCR